jgi:hypothetical protein
MRVSMLVLSSSMRRISCVMGVGRGLAEASKGWGSSGFREGGVCGRRGGVCSADISRERRLEDVFGGAGRCFVLVCFGVGQGSVGRERKLLVLHSTPFSGK